ncbi:hypothetical protein L3X38_037045 [Prunus dulcis]|uniref:Uncharacterized protein n=1 Tax=Prunus dulcis TaxID=3755 RepID=A0AAD4V3R9_PRUDU|nr:hypothetical protein L3X38_037045 [Prunus dulcis]
MLLLLLKGNPLLEHDVLDDYDYWYEFHNIVLYENTHGVNQRPWEEVMSMMIESIDAIYFYLHRIDDLPVEAHPIPFENLPQDEDLVNPPAVEDEDPMNRPMFEDPMDLQVVDDQIVDNQAQHPIEDESDESTIAYE